MAEAAKKDLEERKKNHAFHLLTAPNRKPSVYQESRCRHPAKGPVVSPASISSLSRQSPHFLGSKQNYLVKEGHCPGFANA